MEVTSSNLSFPLTLGPNLSKRRRRLEYHVKWMFPFCKYASIFVGYVIMFLSLVGYHKNITPKIIILIFLLFVSFFFFFDKICVLFKQRVHFYSCCVRHWCACLLETVFSFRTCIQEFLFIYFLILSWVCHLFLIVGYHCPYQWVMCLVILCFASFVGKSDEGMI